MTSYRNCLAWLTNPDLPCSGGGGGGPDDGLPQLPHHKPGPTAVEPRGSHGTTQSMLTTVWSCTSWQEAVGNLWSEYFQSSASAPMASCFARELLTLAPQAFSVEIIYLFLRPGHIGIYFLLINLLALIYLKYEKNNFTLVLYCTLRYILIPCVSRKEGSKHLRLHDFKYCISFSYCKDYKY